MIGFNDSAATSNEQQGLVDANGEALATGGQGINRGQVQDLSSMTCPPPEDDPSSPEGGVGVVQAPDDYYHEDAVAATSDEGQSPAPQTEDETPALAPSPPEQAASVMRPEEPEGKGEELPKKLLFPALLSTCVSLFCTPGNRVPYATFQIGERAENLRLKSKAFRSYVGKLYFETEGAPLSPLAYKDLMAFLEAKALYESPEYEVHLRFAEHDGAIYVDLANDKGQVVRITTDDYQTIPSLDCPVKFIRSPRTMPMVAPEEGGAFDELWDILNINEDHHRILIMAWLVGAMQPNGPYPILVLQGEQGSGKSSLSRVLRDLIDPSFPGLFSVPSSERDLAIAAFKSRLLAFDNLSSVANWLSDAFCRVSTGGGFATRAIYTDDEEAIYDLKRPVITNGIAAFSNRNDMNDRAIFINLPPIAKEERIPEKVIMERWNKAKPRVLGALFSAISCALRNRDKVGLQNYPRMADFAHWVVAAEPALPSEPGSFIREYHQNRTNVIEDAIYSDLVAQAVRKLVNDAGEFSGTPSQLLAKLNELTPDAKRRDRSWPTMPNVLSNRLRRVATFLRERGIDIQFSKSGVRNIAIAMVLCNECACEVGAPPPLATPSCQGRSMVDFSDQSLRQVTTTPLANNEAVATAAIGGAV
jgi:hypothetical protein